MLTRERIATVAKSTILAGTTLNALANNGLVLSAAFNNIAGQALDGAPGGWLTLTYKFQVAPTANTGFSVWILGAVDHTADASYEDGSATVTPARTADIVLGSVVEDTNAHQIEKYVQLKAGYIKFLIKSDGTGQTLTASDTDNVLTFCPEERTQS